MEQQFKQPIYKTLELEINYQTPSDAIIINLS